MSAVSRRGFLGQAAGLAIAFYVPFEAPKVALAAAAKGATGATGAKAAAKVPPLPPANAFLHIGADDSVTVLLAHSEMGQSMWTALPMLIAEELDCDWSKVRAAHAPAADVYKFPLFGMQMTGGSSSTHGEFDRYRNVGATAKHLLLQAAAARLHTSADRLQAKDGVITFGTRTLRYGEVADEAMKLPQPAAVKLKDPKEWKLIGKPTKRIDSPEKIDGTAKFGIDVQFPGLRTAVVARPPAFGAKLVSFDDAAALAVRGVEKVVRTGNDGVAVVAKNFWAAKRGRDALEIQWKAPENGGVSTTKQIAEFHELARKPGAIGTTKGDVDTALASAAGKIEVDYGFPYLAHAPMEPLNCAVKLENGKAEVWTGTQFQTMDQVNVARVFGIKPEDVTINTMFLGGGFGRRGNPKSDWVTEAAEITKAAGFPVKTVWTREDDIRGGYYRPSYLHRVTVGVDTRGMPVAWDHVVVGQSIAADGPFEAVMVKHGVDATSVEGIGDNPYLESVAAKRVSLHSPKTAIPVLWWRSVGNTHTAFAMECAVDELAHRAGKDPLEYRLQLLEGKTRHLNLLKLAAARSSWSTPPEKGRGRGMAIHESFGSIVAEVAEVSVDNGVIRVHAVTCAVDCGGVVNPLGVEAQVQGSVAFGLTAALHGELTFRDGRVDQSNFHDYKPLRMYEMPVVTVHTLDSGAKRGGIGEPATAPIAPAIANAVFALTGQRLRSLPLRLA